MANIILYLLHIIQQQSQQITFFLQFLNRHVPLRRWRFDDSRSPAYQKFSTDSLPVVIYREPVDFRFLLEYYRWRYGRSISPVKRRSSSVIPKDCTCPRCQAPHSYLYRNNGAKGQLLCKICGTAFSPADNRFSKSHQLRCPHCGHALSPKKHRKFFVIHKCVNSLCPFYLKNLKKVEKQHLQEPYGKNRYKLHYSYREFTVDFFSMDLDSLPGNASSLRFRKHDSYVMSLCLTFHVNLGLSLRKTSQALRELYNIHISHQQVANYARSAALVVKPFVDRFPYPVSDTMIADETYIQSFRWSMYSRHESCFSPLSEASQKLSFNILPDALAAQAEFMQRKPKSLIW